MTLEPGSRIGPYEVVSLLGSGGMGEVYRARDSKLQRDVAIKILPPAFASDPDRLARFEREAQVLASLNHPNIGAIYGFEEKALVLELVEGPTLADRIAQGPVPLDEALPIAKQIAEALEAAHEHGVIHRDLKPANIKLRPDGTVKVLDFGLAKLHDPTVTSSSNAANALSLSPTVMSPAMTQVGIILGTAGYMSPEQARGRAVDRRADIWAFGCILYEMLSGTAPFTGEDVSLTLSSVLQRHVDWTALPAAARPVVPLLERCLDKDPKRRLRDIGEACLALDADALRRSTATAPAAPAARGVSVRLAGAAVLGAGVLTGAAAWTLRPATSVSSRPPVVRLSVTLPPGERIAAQGFFGATAWAPLALSPDGAQLAYVSGPRLVLRAMNSLEVRTPQGTDEAQSPFFSPDGQWVAFFAQGQLKKVSIAGGLATPVTDAPVGAGGTWADDGSIYFAPTNMTGLVKVSSDGGAAVPVTTLDRSKGEVSHRWPQVLPGGTRLLFTVWRGPGWDEMDVQVHDLTTGQRTVVVRGANTGRYLRSGHLVYTRAGELTAVPFDVERLAVTGPPVSLGIEVQEQEGAHYTVSNEGLLAYVPGRGQRQHKLIAVTQNGRVEDLGAPIRAYEDVVPSPDGRRLAVTVQGGSWGIWVFDPLRKTESLLTRGAATSQWPVWTPDGARLIYRGTRNGSRNLYWRRADGTGDEERLTTSDLMETPTSTTPDGKWLVYTQTHPKTGSDIWRLPLDGARTPEPMMTSPASENDPQLSPDGRWLAFTSSDSGRDQVYIQPFPGPGERVIVSSDGGYVPRWARDGRRLFYAEGETLLAVEIATSPSLRVGTPQRLASTTGRLAEFEPLPDGRWAMIERTQPPESSTQIHVVVNWFEELTERMAARR